MCFLLGIVIISSPLLALGIRVLSVTAIAVAAPSLLVQSESASDVMNTTTSLTTPGAIASSNNSSNVTLGNLFYSVQTLEESINPINETYIVISYVDNVTLMPPNATAGVVINATERQLHGQYST